MWKWNWKQKLQTTTINTTSNNGKRALKSVTKCSFILIFQNHWKLTNPQAHPSVFVTNQNTIKIVSNFLSPLLVMSSDSFSQGCAYVVISVEMFCQCFFFCLFVRCFHNVHCVAYSEAKFYKPLNPETYHRQTHLFQLIVLLMNTCH